MRVGVPDPIYLSLVHALTATSSAAAYTGLRESKTPEAKLLTHADRISGNAQLESHHVTTPRPYDVSRQKYGTKTFTQREGQRSTQRLHGMEALLRSIKSPTSNSR